MQAASPGTYVGRRCCYLTVLRKQVYAAHGYELSNLYGYLRWQPETYTQREVFKNIIIDSEKDKTTCGGTKIWGREMSGLEDIPRSF